MTQSLRVVLRGLLTRRAPQLLALVRAVRNHHTFVRQYAAFQSEIARALYGDSAISVLAGPFAEMRQVDIVTHGCSTPRWIGSYEQELHEAVERAIARRPRTVVNVGCAEGYYAVGLARRLPGARIYAFDVDPWARRALRRLAAANRVSNVIVRGFCRPTDLQGLCACGRALVVCDIEGGEYELLDPARVPALRSADIIVELHTSSKIDIEVGQAIMRAWFSPTHSVEAIQGRSKNLADWRPIVEDRLTDAELSACIEERRGNLPKWLLMWTRDQG